ncbi:hypothetical protein A3Q56_07762 [Intoshia linei]|uniref:Protein kinase domain-containing protein n=1 Tax=Intoshia linei TaxID=1819745 RepID=A0A177ARD0_9BILA|nr:hypothetical protein A3Q56_07762 [Intoshia linei]
MNKGIMENKRNPVFNDTKKPKKLDSKEDVRRLDFKGKPIQKQTNGDKIVHVKGVPAYSSTMEPVDISYVNEEIVGSGSFGSVYKINLSDKNGTKCAAIKKVLQDKRFKNRELVIMRKIQHTNIVDFYYHFFSHDEKNDVCLNLIMEYIPETLYHEARRYSRLKQSMPIIYVQSVGSNNLYSCGYCSEGPNQNDYHYKDERKFNE